VAQLLDIRFFTASSFRLKVEIPILLSRYPALFVSERMTGRQLFDIAEDTQRVGNITENQVRIERLEIDLSLNMRMLEDRLYFRTEYKIALSCLRVIER